MGLFGFGKNRKIKGYECRMLFNSPMDDERDQKIKELALKHLRDAGVVVNNVKTTSYGYDGSKADFTGQEGELISIECARTPMSESSSSYLAIIVKTNVCSEETINNAFSDVKSATNEMGYYFTEF